MNIIYSLYSNFLFCHFSLCGSPSCPQPPWSFFLSPSFRLTLLSFCQHSCFLLLSSPPTPPPPLIISCLSSLTLWLTPPPSRPVSPPPSLFSVSVEPLWLHRYTDCWLCRGSGMLFWHSTRRYCTSSTLPLSHNLCTNRPPVLDQILRPVCFAKGTHYACLYFFTYIICLICELLTVSITITVTEDQWQICT